MTSAAQMERPDHAEAVESRRAPVAMGILPKQKRDTSIRFLTQSSALLE